MHSNGDDKEKKRTLVIAYFAWGVAAFFFFYQYILRVAPGVMIHEIRQDFQINADQFATLGSFYLYAYALLQIPLGIIVDRIGVRRTIFGSILLCLGGSLLLADSHVFFTAQLSRIMIGAGSASAFMCALKIVSDRLPTGRRGLLMGATLALGTFGALIAGKPLVYFLNEFGWRTIMIYITLLGVVLLLCSWIFTPKHAKRTSSLSKEDIRAVGQNILSIIKNKRVMLYALLSVGLYTPLSTLGDLWGTAFLMQKFSLPHAEAAQTSMMMYIGLAAGSLLMPWICEKHNLLDRAIQFCGLGIIILFAFLLYGPVINTFLLTALLICLGFFCAAEMICFTGALLFSNPNNSGLTVGIINTFMLGGALLQQFIGITLDFHWSGLLDEHGIRVYESHHFVIAFSALTVIIILCCFASLKLIKKKRENESAIRVKVDD